MHPAPGGLRPFNAAAEASLGLTARQIDDAIRARGFYLNGWVRAGATHRPHVVLRCEAGLHELVLYLDMGILGLLGPCKGCAARRRAPARAAPHLEDRRRAPTPADRLPPTAVPGRTRLTHTQLAEARAAAEKAGLYVMAAWAAGASTTRRFVRVRCPAGHVGVQPWRSRGAGENAILPCSWCAPSCSRHAAPPPPPRGPAEFDESAAAAARAGYFLQGSAPAGGEGGGARLLTVSCTAGHVRTHRWARGEELPRCAGGPRQSSAAPRRALTALQALEAPGGLRVHSTWQTGGEQRALLVCAAGHCFTCGWEGELEALPAECAECAPARA